MKLITKFFLAASLLLCEVSCQKQNESEVSDTVVIRTELTAKTPATLVGGGTDQITIYATCDWSLEPEDWFTIEPKSGSKGVSEAVITTQPNTTGADRTGTIRLKAGSYTGTYTFIQSGK